MTTKDANVQILNEAIVSQDEKTPSVVNLLHMPTEVLLKIFAASNDVGLSQVASTCTRFEPIAQLLFEQRYATKYFVVRREYAKSIYETLIDQFHKSIKAVEVQKFKVLSNTHWLMRILARCPVERFKFVGCDFENVKNTLINHENLTHLAFQGGCGYSFVKLPYVHNLREFKVHHFDGMYYADYIKVIRNNRQLRVIEIVDDSVNDPYEIVECVHRCHQHLDQLRVINEAKSLKFSSTDELNAFESVAKCVESLGISTDNASVENLRRLSSSCKNITHLELFHVDHMLSNEIIDVIGSFEQIKSLSLVLKSYEEEIVPIVEKLPNLTQLSLKYRCRTPTSNNYVLTLLRKCENLMHIVVDTHIDRFKPKQPSVTAEFRDNFNEITENRCDSVVFELKEEGKIITTIKNEMV